MFDLLFRLTRSSLWVVTKVIELPFHLHTLIVVLHNAACAGFFAFLVPVVVFQWGLGIDCALLFVPWGVAAALLQLARGLHAVYVRGEYPE